MTSLDVKWTPPDSTSGPVHRPAYRAPVQDTIHASPTCVMRFDEVRRELAGPLHSGMRAMFTMMNAARLSIGMQGPAAPERTYQQAHSYATTRVQGNV